MKRGGLLALSAFGLVYAGAYWLVSGQNLMVTNWAFCPFVAGLVAFLMTAAALNRGKK